MIKLNEFARILQEKAFYLQLEENVGGGETSTKRIFVLESDFKYYEVKKVTVHPIGRIELTIEKMEEN